MLCYEGKAQIVQTNRKLGVKVTAQNGQRHEKYGEYALEFGINMALYSSEKVETSQPFINVVIMKTAGLIYCADGLQFSVVSPLLKYHNGLTRGRARSTVHFPGRLEKKNIPRSLKRGVSIKLSISQLRLLMISAHVSPYTNQNPTPPRERVSQNRIVGDSSSLIVCVLLRVTLSHAQRATMENRFYPHPLYCLRIYHVSIKSNSSPVLPRNA